jgi:hypothetical protein
MGWNCVRYSQKGEIKIVFTLIATSWGLEEGVYL